jgi:hypothetical protein
MVHAKWSWKAKATAHPDRCQGQQKQGMKKDKKTLAKRSEKKLI